MEKPNNIVRIPCSLDKSFFRFWFLFLKPFHNLTDREMDVLIGLLKNRYELSKVIKDGNILDTVALSEDSKKKVMGECNMKLPHFQVIMGKLRHTNIIINNKINPRFIPNINEEGNTFKLLLLFELNDTPTDAKIDSK